MDNYLPIFAHLPSGLRDGRSVHDGYQRGWGLEFSDLRQKIAADSDYVAAFQLAQNRSVVASDRLMNLFLLVKFYLPRLSFGHIIEYGSYRGGSAFFLAALAGKFLPGAMVYALDTFSGIAAADSGLDAHRAGDFSTTDFEELSRAKTELGLGNLEFVRGLFSDTAPGVLAEAKSVALAHIDCDTYEAVKYAYIVSKPKMVHAGYFVFDDSTSSSCIGATQAVEECVIRDDGRFSEQIFPHHVFRS